MTRRTVTCPWCRRKSSALRVHLAENGRPAFRHKGVVYSEDPTKITCRVCLVHMAARVEEEP